MKSSIERQSKSDMVQVHNISCISVRLGSLFVMPPENEIKQLETHGRKGNMAEDQKKHIHKKLVGGSEERKVHEEDRKETLQLISYNRHTTI